MRSSLVGSEMCIRDSFIHLLFSPVLENTRRFQSCLISPVVSGKGVAKPALHVQPKSLSEENTQVTNTSPLRFVLTQPRHVLMRSGAASESLPSPGAELCAQLLSFCSLWKKISPLTKNTATTMMTRCCIFLVSGTRKMSFCHQTRCLSLCSRSTKF